ncbi:MAG: toxin-antitoxin system protein [Roseburia sp.]|nr:toxin-antitoxin system protein [Roseburia sp.]
MVFEFFPWVLDVDVEATKRLYLKNDYSIDNAVNTKFIKQLSQKQNDFFMSVGVNPMKIRIEEMAYNIPDSEIIVKNNKTLVDFMICGKFFAIPNFQKEIYGEVFEEELPDFLKTTTIDDLLTYDIDDFGVVFKHPVTRFDTEDYQSWDCGYIIGTILIKTES